MYPTLDASDLMAAAEWEHQIHREAN